MATAKARPCGPPLPAPARSWPAQPPPRSARWRPGQARDCRQHAVRQLNPAHCYELNPPKHRARRAASARWGWSGPSRGSIARKPSPISRSAVDSKLIERDRRNTEVAAVRHSDLLLTAIHAASLPSQSSGQVTVTDCNRQTVTDWLQYAQIAESGATAPAGSGQRGYRQIGWLWGHRRSAPARFFANQGLRVGDAYRCRAGWLSMLAGVVWTAR